MEPEGIVSTLGAGPGTGTQIVERGVPELSRCGNSNSCADFADSSEPGISLSGIYPMDEGLFCDI